MNRITQSIVFALMLTLAVSGAAAADDAATDAEKKPTQDAAEAAPVHANDAANDAAANGDSASPDQPTEPNPANVIDKLVENRLHNAGLAPANAVDANVLYRRTFLDLTGLPPTAAQLNAAKLYGHENTIDFLLNHPARTIVCPIAANDLLLAQRNALAHYYLFVDAQAAAGGDGAKAKDADAEAGEGEKKKPTENNAVTRARWYMAQQPQWKQADINSYWAATFAGQQCQRCHTAPHRAWNVQTGELLVDWVAAPDAAKKPWIGVSVGPLDGALRAQLRLPDEIGVVITKVAPDSPAQQAGVEEHDILLSIDGKPIAGGEDLDKIIHAAKADDPPLKLALIHGGQKVTREVTPKHPQLNMLELMVKPNVSMRYRIGVHIDAPDATLRKHLGLSENQGVVVTKVIEASPAEAAGVKQHDVIVAAAGKTIESVEMLTELIRNSEGKPVELELLRAGVNIKLLVTPRKEVAAADYLVELADAYGGIAHEQLLVSPGVVVEGTRLTAPLDLYTQRAGKIIWLSDASKPHAANDAATGDPGAAEKSADRTAQRLDQIGKQLDALTKTVNELRKGMEAERQKQEGPAKQPKKKDEPAPKPRK